MRSPLPFNKKIAAAALGICCMFLTAAPALASLSDATGLGASAGAAGLRNTQVDLPTLIGRFIGGLLGLLGVVFVLLMIYGGFTWMTAQGSEEKVKKAKGIMSSAVIGLVLVFASYAIANAVISAISSAMTSGTPPAEDGG